MATYSKSAKYYSSVTSVARQCPIFVNGSGATGDVNKVTITASFRGGTNSSTATTYSFTAYLFKTFTGSSSYWSKRYENSAYPDCSVIYQYPQNTSYYVKTSYLSDILGSITSSVTLSYQSSKTVTLTFNREDLTTLGKDVSNWYNAVGLAIICSDTNLNWTASGTSTQTITYGEATSNQVYYCTGNTYQKCEVYYCTGTRYVLVSPKYCNGYTYLDVGG